MTKDEIKKALECCNSTGPYFCDDCPYCCVGRCRDELITSALNLITEQEKEIDRLKAKDEETCLKCIESKHATAEEYAKLQEQFANYQLASGKEIMAQVKQAKIDVLNELKPLLEGYIHKTTGESLYVYTCKMFNIEVEDAEDKSYNGYRTSK